MIPLTRVVKMRSDNTKILLQFDASSSLLPRWRDSKHDERRCVGRRCFTIPESIVFSSCWVLFFVTWVSLAQVVYFGLSLYVGAKYFDGAFVKGNDMLGPSPATLEFMGAVSEQNIITGQLWKLGACVLVQKGLIQLALAAWVQLRVGYVLELRWGSPAFACIFSLAGIGGALFALANTAPDTQTVGPRAQCSVCWVAPRPIYPATGIVSLTTSRKPASCSWVLQWPLCWLAGGRARTGPAWAASWAAAAGPWRWCLPARRGPTTRLWGWALRCLAPFLPRLSAAGGRFPSTALSNSSRSACRDVNPTCPLAIVLWLVGFSYN